MRGSETKGARNVPACAESCFHIYWLDLIKVRKSLLCFIITYHICHYREIIRPGIESGNFKAHYAVSKAKDMGGLFIQEEGWAQFAFH